MSARRNAPPVAAPSRRARVAVRAGSRAGFTLVELLVAVGLTGIVAVGLYSLSQVASQTFQQQQRVSEMQLRLRTAIESIRADVARAGYMATPSSGFDPRVCPRPTQPVQAVQLEAEASNPTHNATANQFINPLRMTLAGNYLSTDEYRIMAIDGAVVSLQHRTSAYNRIAGADAFERIFLGRMVRITGTNGVMQFGRVRAVQFRESTSAADSYPTLTLDNPPMLIGASVTGSTATAGCGVPGMGVGATIAPIALVQYRIGDVSATQANAYSGTTNSPMRFGKTDLVRTEFNTGAEGNVEVEGSQRIVAEYAVDFDVAAVVTGITTAANGDPQVTALPWGDARNTTILGPLSGGATPHRVRALRVRLSVRDRVQDPDFGWTSRGSANDPLTRFQVFPSQRGAARVRSVTTEIALPNVGLRNL